jgi:hypothetical protein
VELAQWSVRNTLVQPVLFWRRGTVAMPHHADLVGIEVKIVPIAINHRLTARGAARESLKEHIALTDACNPPPHRRRDGSLNDRRQPLG